MDTFTRSSNFYPSGGWAPSYSTTAGPQQPPSPIYSQAQNSSHRYNCETRPLLKLQPTRPSLTDKLTSSPATPSNENKLSFTAPRVSDFSIKPPTTTPLPTPPARLSQPEMVTAVKSFLEQVTPPDSMELDGLSWDQFEKLREEVSSFPGWSKVSYVVFIGFVIQSKSLIEPPAWILSRTRNVSSNMLALNTKS
jgi:hypothetical protein